MLNKKDVWENPINHTKPMHIFQGERLLLLRFL